jgi:Carboxypeptidase regulatory-like domain/TonB dependent receptor
MEACVRKLTVLVLLILSCGFGSLFGQGGGAIGTIVGTVTDPGGAIVPDASVEVKNTETNIVHTTSSSSAGTFSVPYLKPGKYQVTVKNVSFSTTVVDDVNLQVDQTVRVNVVLKVGAVTENVAVSAQSLTLDTDSASVGQVITDTQVANLPLNGRNFMQLITLGPGATSQGGTEAITRRPNTTSSYSLMGGRDSSNGILLDGMFNNDMEENSVAIIPSLDAIQEFKEQTATFSAEYGKSAEQINLSTKSGTNSVHGTAYDFLRNDFLDARAFFDPDTLPPLRQNQFGYSLGGPVFIPKLYDGRNRTFFFANYEGQRTTSGTTIFGEVPTEGELNGVFPVEITDPNTGHTYAPGTQLPSSIISVFGQQAKALFPAPNADLPQGNFETTTASKIVADQQNYRIDQVLGANNFLFGRYSGYQFTTTVPSQITPEGDTLDNISDHSVVVSYTHTFSASAVNRFMGGYLRVTPTSQGVKAPESTIAAFGLKGIFPYGPYSALPQISFGLIGSGLGLSTVGGGGNLPDPDFQHNYDFTDSLSINKGPHSINVGFGFLKSQWGVFNAENQTGQFTFSGAFTGHPIADLLLGHPSQVRVAQPTPYSDTAGGAKFAVNWNTFAPYIQDNWQATPKLTVNIGLRYDYQSIPSESQNHMAWLNLSAPGGGICVADKTIITQGLGGGIYSYCGKTPGSAQKLVFAPRVGFAYRPFGDGKTVIRSAYGVFYDSYEQGEYAVSGAVYPWIVNGSYNAVPGQSMLDTANLFPDYSQHIGPVTEQIVQSNYLLVPQANPKAPYAQQWSFSIQRELDARTTLEVNYVGTKGTHLFNRILLSQPLPPADPQNPTLPATRLLYPNLPESFVIEDEFNGPSNYNGMNVKLEHRASNFFLLAAYTWAKSMDIKSAASGIAGDAGAGTPMNTYDLAADYGPSSYDATQRFVASGVYSLPIGQGKQFMSNANKATDLFVGGWQFNGIALFQTGLPYTVFGFDAGGCLGTFSQRASLVGKPNPSGFQGSPAEWFDTTAFVNPAPCYFGTSGRNLMRAPGRNNFDLSLFKNVTIKERLSLQLRLESFNAFNHTQFGIPDNTVSDTTFGAVSSTQPARINQLGAKLIW